MEQKRSPGGVLGRNLFYLAATERTEPRAHTEMLSPWVLCYPIYKEGKVMREWAALKARTPHI